MPSTTIASKSNHNTEHANSLYAFKKSLCRTGDGRRFFSERGGAAMAVDLRREYVDRREAVEFVATEATDPITGWGYTREQAEQMVDGHDAGKGYREV